MGLCVEPQFGLAVSTPCSCTFCSMAQILLKFRVRESRKILFDGCCLQQCWFLIPRKAPDLWRSEPYGGPRCDTWQLARFRGWWYLHLQGQRVKKKTGTQHSIPENLNVQQHLHEDLKPPLSKFWTIIRELREFLLHNSHLQIKLNKPKRKLFPVSRTEFCTASFRMLFL